MAEGIIIGLFAGVIIGFILCAMLVMSKIVELMERNAELEERVL